MKYSIAIEQTDQSAYGVVVPDLPGCFSAGDSLDEAISNSKEAIELWLETAVQTGNKIPDPANLAFHKKNPEFFGWSWATVEIDKSALSGKFYKVSITPSANL